jgi:uncharacterized protein (DUF2236 family)
MAMKARIPLRTEHWEEVLASLDAEKQAEDVVRILANHVFPLEFLVSLELAQFRTFTIPSISALLHSTGQYEREGPKRLDDTRAILVEISRPGLESEASREMVEHLNRIHGLYSISNDDFLYVLSTFVFDPVPFIERWGHRPLTLREQDALYFVHLKLAQGMRIRDVPKSREAFLAWRRAYEARVQTYAPQNEAVARGMMDAVASSLPPVLRSLTAPLTLALMDDAAMFRALGFAEPSPAVAFAMRLAARAYRKLSQRLNPFEHLALRDAEFFQRYSTYPNGYSRLKLGPTKVLAFLEKQRQGDGDRVSD